MRGEVSRTEARAVLALEGDVLLDEEELEFDSARVILRDQSVWTDWRSWTDENADIATSMPRIRHLGEQRLSLGVDGATLSVTDAATAVCDADNWSLKNACEFDLRLEHPLVLDDLEYQWLRPLRLLLVTSTGRQSGLERLMVSNVHVREPLGEDKDGEAQYLSPWLEVQSRRGQRSTADLSPLECRHLMSDFDLTTQIRAFFVAADRHRYALERYEEVRSESLSGPNAMFLNAVQAIEALDTGLHEDHPQAWQEEAVEIATAAAKAAHLNSDQRRQIGRALRQAHAKSLSSRLRRIDDETGSNVTSLVGSARWADELETLRNALTHGRTGDVLRSASGALTVATQIATLLFDLRWLQVIGFGPDNAIKLLRRRAHQWADEKQIEEYHNLLTVVVEGLKAPVPYEITGTSTPAPSNR